MTKLVIYKSTLVYAALYLKRSAEPDGPITLTEKEFQDYFDLVIDNVEEERSIANAFTYDIVYDGEPEYKLNMASKETLDLIKTATYQYNADGTSVTTHAGKTALSYKSTHAFPQALASSLRPAGYEKALNIIKKKGNPTPVEPKI